MSKATSKAPKRTGTLHILAGLLISSALIRAATTTPLAFAEAAPATPVPEPPTAMAMAEPVLAPTEPVDTGTLLAALQERESRIAQREAQLADRLQALRVTEAEVGAQLAALTEAEERLRQTIALADVAAENDLSTLTQVYENMKPKDAAALFEEMSPEFAAGFLGMMRPDAAAQIMTGLAPETAYTISVILAGRNAGVPTQ